MVLPQKFQTDRWPALLAAAAGMSLVAITGFTALLGLFFLPGEFFKLSPPERVSVTHYLPPEPARPGVALCWSIPETGGTGWQFFLRLDASGREPGQEASLDPGMQPTVLAVDHGGRGVLVGDMDGSIYSLDVQSPQDRVLVGRQQGGGVVEVASSDDGRYVVSQDPIHLYGWDRIGRKPLWFRAGVRPNCLVVRPDKPAAIVGSQRGELLEIDLATGNVIRQLAMPGALPQALAISSDGDRLAIVTAEGNLHVADSRTFETIWSREARWSFASSRYVAFSPCGRWLATPSLDNMCEVGIWEAKSGDYRASLGGHADTVLGATFADDGQLYSFASDGAVRKWNVQAAPFGLARRSSRSRNA